MTTLAAGAGLLAPFRALAHRPFALLWSGQTLSRVGDHLYQIALAWWVLEKTGSVAVMGTVLIFAFAPMLLFLLVGGVAVDRFARVRVTLLCDLARGAVVAAVAALAFSQRLEVWHVLAASLVFGLVDAFFHPAYTAAVPELNPPDALPSANALTSLGQQFGRIAGPAMGAAIVGLGGTPAAFALNALSFVVSAACLAPLASAAAPPRPTSPTTPQDTPSVLRDLREGIGTVLGAPWLWITIAVAALANVTLAGPYSVALPFLVRDALGGDVVTLGFLCAMFPLGYALAGLWLGRAVRLRPRGVTAYAGILVAGLGMLALGLPLPLAALALAALANGAALEIFGLIWTNVLQERVPRERLGRVSSIDSLGSYALLPLGYGLVGWATDWLGPAPVCLLGGAVTVALAVLGLARSAIRKLD